MMNILPLASSSKGNCLYIELASHRFLVDIGVSFRYLYNTLNINNIQLNTIEGLFITHLHSDHTIGLNRLDQSRNFPLISSSETINSLQLKNCIGLKFDEKIEIFPGLFVTMFKTSHDCKGSGGFIFESKNQKIGYCTDLGYISTKIIDYLTGSNVVIIESNHDLEMLENGPYPLSLKRRIHSAKGHLSNEDCALAIEYLFKKGTKIFLLAHLSQHNNTPILAYQACLDKVDNQTTLIALPVKGQELLKF